MEIFNPNNENVANIATSKPNVPGTDLELMQAAKFVYNKWQNSPDIKLIWSNAEELGNLIASYEALIDQKADIIMQRKMKVHQMKLLNQEIDVGIERLKTKLIGLFGRDESKEYYHQIGLEHFSGGYKLPGAYFARTKALEKLIKAIQELQLQEGDYGLSFWQDSYTQFVALSDHLASFAGEISLISAEKNKQKALLRKTLYSLFYVIKANYVDNFKAVARQWGLLKERF